MFFQIYKINNYRKSQYLIPNQDLAIALPAILPLRNQIIELVIVLSVSDIINQVLVDELLILLKSPVMGLDQIVVFRAVLVEVFRLENRDFHIVFAYWPVEN